jgi:hypothetical protein
LREGRRRLAAGHLTAQGGGDPAPDPGLHRLPADTERLGQRPQRPARLAQRGQRGRQQLAAPGGTQLAEPRRDALGQLGGYRGASSPPVRGGFRGGPPRGGRGAGGGGGGPPPPPPCAGGSGGSPPRVSTATYWRRPCVTTSDIVRPSRARRALSCCLCSWSSRKVSSRRLGRWPFSLIPPRP